MSLRDKFYLYLSMVPSKQDCHGFIYSDKCDSLLFTGLIGTVPGISVDIDQACDREGSWHRRPLSMPECYPNGSKSSISRDMLLGLAWFAYFNGRLDISEGVIKYALSHWMVMGKGAKSRTIMTPGLLSTFAWISYRLGGPSRPWLRYLPQVESKKATDYQAHLSVLHIVLRRMLTGKENYGSLLAYHAERMPQNPLFQWAAGYKEKAIAILMDEKLWPADRLPTNHDRSGEWLLERDMGHNWLPGDGEKHTLSGGDFLFLANLVLGH